MGFFDWFRKSDSTALDEVLAREPVVLPPRQSRAAEPARPVRAAALPPMAFAGEAAEQVARDLFAAAATISDPNDRLFVSTLIRAVKNEGVELPAMPEDVIRIQRVLANPDCDARELARAIKHDPALSTRFVSVANSPLYRRAERTNTVEDSVVRVGMKQATSLVLAIVSKAKMFRVADDAAAADRLHRHALAAGVAAKLIAPNAEVENDAFLGGLLHDLGRVFMLSVASNQYRDSRGQSRVRPTTLDYLVDKLHAGFSGLVAERWGFSQPLVHALLHHHLPEEGGADLVILVPPFAEELTHTLACADLIAHLVLEEDLDADREAALVGMLEKIGAGEPEEVVVDTKDAYEALQYELGRNA